jgi:hypothetical protein
MRSTFEAASTNVSLTVSDIRQTRMVGSRNHFLSLQARKIDILIVLFTLGWVTYSFSIFDFGRVSITLMQLAAAVIAFRIGIRSLIVLLPISLSAVLAATMAFIDSSDARIFAALGNQILAILFCAAVATMDWRKHLQTLQRTMVALGFPLVAYAAYQVFARARHLQFAFLAVTNQQEHAIGGLQRGWNKAAITRASSVFVEPSEFGYFCLWLYILGLSATTRVRLPLLSLAVCGVACSQSLSAFLGLLILTIVYCLGGSGNIRGLANLAPAILVAFLMGIAAFAVMPNALDSFSNRIHAAFMLDERADSDRVSQLPHAMHLFEEAPILGQGLAALPPEDGLGGLGYFDIFVERGVVGAALFLIPWVSVAVFAFLLPRNCGFRELALMLSALNLYTFSTFSTMYYLPFWLSLGILISLMGSKQPNARWSEEHFTRCRSALYRG